MQSINIPKYLQELHGKQASVVSLVLVYANALIFAIVISYFIQPLDLTVWKSILLFIIVADIAGGAVANFTYSTRQYYRENHKLQIPFLLMHIIHPLFLFLLLPDFKLLFIFMGVFTFASVTIIKFLGQRNYSKFSALILFIIGTAITLLMPCSLDYLKMILILFYIKLIMGFAVGVFSKS
jgi:hypothetical protein